MIHPSMAWGPPIAPTINGSVTKGPTPTMSMTLRPSAEVVERPRCSSAGLFVTDGWILAPGNALYERVALLPRQSPRTFEIVLCRGEPLSIGSYLLPCA